MAISFVGKGAFGSGTASVSAAAVTGVVAGDLLLLFVESANQPITAPTGWTQVTNSPVATGTAAAAGGVALQVFYQFATGADTSTTVGDSGDHTTCIKLAYRGVDPLVPFDATPVSGTKATASTSSSFPGITTTTANAWVVMASALDLDAASTATTGTPTNANLTGLTERHDQTVTSGAGGGLVIIDGIKLTAGATGNTTATVTSTIQVYLTMALREEVDTGSGAATEVGPDTLSATGKVIINGSLSASETGADHLSASGVLTSAVHGSMAATETGSDTLSATGSASFTPVTGSFSATETGSDALASTGKVIVKGALSATETGADTASATGKVLIKGSGAFAETGSDTASATGKVLIKGAASAAETGSDSASASGKVLVKGAASALETGTDVASVSGKVLVKGSAAGSESGQDIFVGTGGAVSAGVALLTESGSDTLSSSGRVVVQGALSVSEVGSDTLSGGGTAPALVSAGQMAASELTKDSLSSTGAVLVKGAAAALEAGSDGASASGCVVVQGSLAVSESEDGITVYGAVRVKGSASLVEADTDTIIIDGGIRPTNYGDMAATEAPDSFGGYVAPGYISGGYVGGVNGTVGTKFEITGQQAMLLRRLYQLHGLADPLEVGKTTRQSGDFVQSISESGGVVTISSESSASGTLFGSVGQMIEEIAALHGIGADLVVSKESRTAGGITQLFETSGGATRVVRVDA